MKDIDTETRNNTVADDVTSGEDMAVERGVKLSRPIERGAEKITYVEITGAIEQAGCAESESGYHVHAVASRDLATTG